MRLRAPVIVFKSLHQFEAMGLVEANGLTILCLGNKNCFWNPALSIQYLNFNNDWVVCLTEDLLQQQPRNTLPPNLL